MNSATPAVPTATSDTAPAAVHAPAISPPSAPLASTGKEIREIQVSIEAGSVARYRVTEQLVGRGFPNDAVGETPDVTGGIHLDADGRVLPGSSFTVNLLTLKSDESRRDNYLRGNSLESSRYPEAIFEVAEVEGLPWPLPETGEFPIALRGVMRVHGTSRPLAWSGTVEFGGEGASGQVSTHFQFGFFNMSVPRVFVVLSVEDDVRLELDFKVSIARA